MKDMSQNDRSSVEPFSTRETIAEKAGVSTGLVAEAEVVRNNQFGRRSRTLKHDGIER